MAQDIHADRILILDFGSQYTQLIARRVRELGVYCELLPFDVDIKRIRDFKPSGIILSGGPESVHDVEANVRAPEVVFELNCPVLGICYGMQTMAEQFGGKVAACAKSEFGYAEIEVIERSVLLEGIEDRVGQNDESLLDVWMSHGDHVSVLPEDFKLLARSENAPIAAMADESRGYYGVQFHPEVTHTRQGARMLERFVRDICGCEALWTPGKIIEDSILQVKKQVGDDEVILALSGGVDSSVVAALLHKALGDKLTCIFVDTGLLRLNEGDEVMRMFADHFGVRVIRVNAEARYLKALEGVSDPEQKRKIIGGLFVEIFDEEAAKLTNAKWLAQGTIYPDVIESAGAASGKAHVIKSHHNVGGLPEDMKLGLVEPLRELFKDEVRKIGLELGLPYEMVYRHPFPGPGLGVRILGEVKKEYADVLRLADAIFIEELRRSGWYEKTSQAFTVFLPVKSVGVMGDGRRYDWVVSLRAVETIDFMTAHWAELPYELLGRISNRIINEVSGISRVVYDISGKPPATIEWE
ncbi:glutamine-hydrolyzing GMP synthase [Piscirickettsia litoralis]|uniref:GMP synthase [glutamine-hydrolyzing] n=1 Tax=Piscirickettsia litoralis TaxID=1891921 RepID=A0ABX3A0T8_9GAMM|nr:glutamine-hydrolyzing GMP synthase [Piscirickettsia litoralis]ODN42418.1 glutamine-hydrolyzing GMP synthase [Piscirickettsia litoralis]